jgi:hypothetical protein
MTAVADKLGMTFPLRLKSPLLSNRAPDSVPGGPLSLPVESPVYHSVADASKIQSLVKQLNSLVLRASKPAEATVAAVTAHDDDTPVRSNTSLPIRSVATSNLHLTPGLHVLPTNLKVASATVKAKAPNASE